MVEAVEFGGVILEGCQVIAIQALGRVTDRTFGNFILLIRKLAREHLEELLAIYLLLRWHCSPRGSVLKATVLCGCDR